MYITKVISYNGAWEKLLSEYQSEFHKLEEDINSQDLSFLLTPEDDSDLLTKITKMSINFEKNLENLGWKEVIAIEHIEHARNSPGLIKKNLCLRVDFYPDTITNFIYRRIKYIETNNITHIKIPIIINLNSYTLRNIDHHFTMLMGTWESSLLELEQISPLSIKMPFLVFGIGFEPDNIEVVELENKKEPIMVERSIEFPPEYYQAGLGLLSYFGTVLRKKYSEQNAKVKIEQDGLTVRMIIESTDGKQEVLEQALHEYELILTGQKQPYGFYESDLDNIELRSELRVAKVKIEDQKELLAYKDAEVTRLQQLFSLSLTHQPTSIKIDNHLSNTNTQNTQINFKAELHQSHDDLEKLINLTDDESIKNRLRDIQNALDNATTRETPEDVQNSSGMKKLGNLLNEANEVGTQANGLLEKGAAAIELLKKLGRHYNKVAEWCGLPVVPGVLVAE